MLHFAEGSASADISREQASMLIDSMLRDLGELHRVLILPPDITRLHSWAGELTVMLYAKLKHINELKIMPTLGTHLPMEPDELDQMYPGIPHGHFLVHDWRKDCTVLGEVPAGVIEEISEGRLSMPVACDVNRVVTEGGWDRIFSVGQLVPHELAGIANFSKNVLIGAGGAETIAKSHFIAAVYGLERLMGRINSPMRKLLNYMEEHFIPQAPVTYLMTVRDEGGRGRRHTRGLFAGDDEQCYLQGARLCRDVSITLLDKPAQKIVAYLPENEFKTTWVGNKSIFRTRMALADGGELVILAPGVRQFGEDAENDAFIRTCGYRTTPEMIELVKSDQRVAANLTPVAHIIISTPDNRFNVTYCPGRLSKSDVESVHFGYADPEAMLRRYDPEKLQEGFNTMPDGEEIYFVSQPSQGLWAVKEKFCTERDE
ncbi:MAG: DUF2088 domain-containing protein [Chitinivibrionales bacterium]|nr:DUF2088 domain-containing protein [Chitinivibrionales bacterium]